MFLNIIKRGGGEKYQAGGVDSKAYDIRAFLIHIVKEGELLDIFHCQLWELLIWEGSCEHDPHSLPHPHKHAVLGATFLLFLV